MFSVHRIAIAAAAVAILAATPALASDDCAYVKNGECHAATTHDQDYTPARKKPKKKVQSWTNPDDYTKPAEKCRAACLRDSVGKPDVGAAFEACKRRKGCV